MSFIVGYLIAWAIIRLTLGRPDIPSFIYRTRLALRGENPSSPTPTEEDEE